jgi:hypothetical protein
MKKKIIGLTLFLAFVTSMGLFSEPKSVKDNNKNQQNTQQKHSARGDFYSGGFEIINIDTLETWREGDFETENRHFSAEQAKQEIRPKLGFPSNSDVRTINGVTYRINWQYVRSK